MAPLNKQPWKRNRDTPKLDEETQRRERRRERIETEWAELQARWARKRPEVNKVNWDGFKNRYHPNELQYAIDVLVGPVNLNTQIRRENLLRRRENPARFRGGAFFDYDLKAFPIDRPRGRGAGGVGTAAAAKATLSSERDKEKEKHKPLDRAKTGDGMVPESDHIHRVRIQSQHVLARLIQLQQETQHKSRPRTFLRPFKALIHFQPKMEKLLESMENSRFHSIITSPTADSAESRQDATADETSGPAVEGEKLGGENPDNQEIADNSDAEQDEVAEEEEELESIVSDDEMPSDAMEDNTDDALRDMHCYVKFVRDEIMPLYHQFDGTTSGEVMFEDLWYLFRVGELVHYPVPANSTTTHHQELWRVYRIEMSPLFLNNDVLDNAWGMFMDEPQHHTTRNGGRLTLSCYYIDHNGSEFGAIRHKFRINSYSGRRNIDSLTVYPVRYAKDSNILQQGLRKQGQEFQKLLSDRHRHRTYNAWTMTTEQPNDRSHALQGSDGDHMHYPEFVESHVIVDIAEAFHANPCWKPRFHVPTINKAHGSYPPVLDDLPIQQWQDRSRTDLCFTTPETVYVQDAVDDILREENFKTDDFLCARAHDSHKNVQEDCPLSDEDIPLLPKRMFAYALRERRFIAVDIGHLKPVLREHGVFEQLKIKQAYKRTIRGLVNSHFRKKDVEHELTNRNIEGLGQDLVQGKGKGLIILLHGVPGVGKTATAEAVAAENSKPLFVITCGDLGLTPEAIEKSLTKVFRLANLWDCVLLLDEADVYLAQRSRLDINRNALVSVFLRVLEYYNGLLFLTTNRVGSIDEAFKSRIHISLYYEPLKLKQTMDIFQVNIDKLTKISEQRHRISGKPMLDIRRDEILQFAREHYQNTYRSGSNWNGRQIRNAFQIAVGLCDHEYADELERAVSASGSQEHLPLPQGPVLGRRSFNDVETVTTQFNNYMQETKGMSDADYAFFAGERADHVRGSAMANPSQYPPRDAVTPIPMHMQPQPGMSFGGSPAGSNGNRSGFDNHYYAQQPPHAAPEQQQRYHSQQQQQQYGSNPQYTYNGGYDEEAEYLQQPRGHTTSSQYEPRQMPPNSLGVSPAGKSHNDNHHNQTQSYRSPMLNAQGYATPPPPPMSSSSRLGMGGGSGGGVSTPSPVPYRPAAVAVAGETGQEYAMQIPVPAPGSNSNICSSQGGYPPPPHHPTMAAYGQDEDDY